MGFGVAAIVLISVVLFVVIMLTMEFFSDSNSGNWNWKKIVFFTVAFFLLLLSCNLVCKFTNQTPNSDIVKETDGVSSKNCKMEVSKETDEGSCRSWKMEVPKCISMCSYCKCRFQQTPCPCCSTSSHSY